MTDGVLTLSKETIEFGEGTLLSAELVKNLTFLVAEDMESMRDVVVSILRNLGVNNIQQAKDGQVAWQILTSKRIDIVICDWDMPNASGLDLLKKIRSSIEHQDTPFLMLTGSTEKDRVKLAITAGASDYLSKPFKPMDLEYRIIKLSGKLKKQ